MPWAFFSAHFAIQYILGYQFRCGSYTELLNLFVIPDH